MMPWQDYVLDDALTIRPDGSWARSQIGLLVSRQQGKTHLMRMRILAGLYIFGEKSAIGMSQTRQLSLDTFKKTVELAESKEWMRKRIKRVSRTNGQEELEVYCHHYPKSCTEKCNRIRTYSIRAATTEGPRGSTADLLYIDELREIADNVLTAALPLTTAVPNAQTYFTSNAGDITSTALNDLRARALQFKSDRLGWYEWSAPEGSDINDREAWKMANPALGYTTDMEKIEDALNYYSRDAFLTERLCMWVDSVSSPWPMQTWNESHADVALEDGLPTWMGLDLNFNRDLACMVTVQQQADGKLAVFLHEWQKDGGIKDVELASEIATLTRRFRPRVLAYDPNTAGFIAPHLARAGVPVAPSPWASAGFAIMCDQTMNAMSNAMLVHPAQETMHQHLVACARRPASDGGWRIARRAAQVPITAAIALVLAVGHATTPQAEVAIYSA